MSTVTQPKARGYDPHQDRATKTKIRAGYRDLMKTLQEKRGDVANVTAQELEEMLKTSNKMFAEVKAPSEAVLDSDFLTGMAELSTARSKVMKVDAGAFNAEAFIVNVKSFMCAANDDDEASADFEWEKLGRVAAQHSRRAPTMEHLYGPLEVKPKTRVASKRAKFVRSALDDGAAVLKKGDIQRSENETTKLVKDIATLLETFDGPVNYFKFVVNPDSFADTIENMFYVSFLVRDGKVLIEDDADGDPMLSLCEAATDENRREGLTKRQLVFDMSMDLWEDLKNVYEITKPLIPTRPKIDRSAVTAGKWY